MKQHSLLKAFRRQRHIKASSKNTKQMTNKIAKKRKILHSNLINNTNSKQLLSPPLKLRKTCSEPTIYCDNTETFHTKCNSPTSLATQKKLYENDYFQHLNVSCLLFCFESFFVVVVILLSFLLLKNHQLLLGRIV